MANQTVYPFGPGGQLPSGIGIINDRHTGGANMAWSAEQGKLICEDVNADELKLYKEQVQLTDFLSITQGEAFMSSASPYKWRSSADNDPTTYGKLIDVSQYRGGTVKIERVAGYAFRYAFLQSNNFAEGELPNFCSGTSCFVIPDTDATPVFEKTIPMDCSYLYVSVSLSGDDVTPDVYVDYDVELETEAQNAFRAINELNKKTPTFDNVSAPIIMTPGVVASNGNVWSITTVTTATVGEKYAHGFVSTALLQVSKNDVLEIDYAKMGVDDTVWKIGVLQLNANGKVFDINGVSTANIPYYLTDTEVSFDEQTKFIRIVLLLRDTSSYTLSEKREMLVAFSVYSHREILESKDFPSNSKTAITFPYVKGVTYPVVKTNIVFDVAATTDYQAKSIGFNNGYLIFPEEYTPNGKGCPLIIFAHGTGGLVFTDPTSPLYYLDFLKNVAKGGYIVADCCTLSSFYYNDDQGTTKSVTDSNWPEPIAWECYHKFYKLLTERYNIDTNRVYIFGKSAGGMNVIMLSQMGYIPIRAAAGLAASIDTITTLRQATNNNINSNPFLHRLGMTDAAVGSKLSGSGDPNYLVSHISQLSGFNPFWYGTSGLDKETQIRSVIADGIDTDTIEADTTLQGVIDNAATFLRTPVKWWHAIDDINVPIATTRMYQKMVRNGGGVFEIREFPVGCGAHHAVDNDADAPTTSYTHRNGVTVTLPTAYAEVLDWFNLWWD